MPRDPYWGTWAAEGDEDLDDIGWSDDGSPYVRPTWTSSNTYA